MRCYAHFVNLLIGDIIKSKEFSETHSKCNKLVNFVKRKSKFLQFIERENERLGVRKTLHLYVNLDGILLIIVRSQYLIMK